MFRSNTFGVRLVSKPSYKEPSYLQRDYSGNLFRNKKNTDSPLYADTTYKDKICYNDNLTVTKTSLKR